MAPTALYSNHEQNLLGVTVYCEKPDKAEHWQYWQRLDLEIDTAQN